MCEFCNKVKKLKPTEFCDYVRYGSAEISLHKTNNNNINLITCGREFPDTAEALIFYCPICGKKLSELLGEEQWKF